MEPKKPRIGDIVIYSFYDHEIVDYRRSLSDQPGALNTNAQKECPAVVVSVHGDACVNVRLIVDNDTVPPRRTSVIYGSGQGMWLWRESGAVQPTLIPGSGTVSHG